VYGLSKTPSGRQNKIRVKFEKGQVKELTGQRLREIVGFSKIKSTAFEVYKLAGGKFRFQGKGHGHGVGLCQWGAKSLAQSGQNYFQILKHYYPQAKLVKLKNRPIPSGRRAGLNGLSPSHL